MPGKVRVTYTDHEKSAPTVTVGGLTFSHNDPVEVDDPAVVGLLKTMTLPPDKGGKGNPFFKVEELDSEPGHPPDRPADEQSDAEKDENDETIRRRGPGRPKGT
jgi:hypothetical protein